MQSLIFKVLMISTLFLSLLGLDYSPCLAQELEITNSIGMKFKLIKAGSFIMGRDDGGIIEQSGPSHKVTITKDFYIGIYEVTQEEYVKIMNENPSINKGLDLPVGNVLYTEAEEFCQKLSELEGITYRIPYESEWEYVCRAGTTTDFPWGDDEALLNEYAWNGNNSNDKQHKVGTKKPNAWGIYDMIGNMEEMTAGNYGLYKKEHLIDPKGHSKPWGTLDCALRGCSFSRYHTEPKAYRSTFRHGIETGSRENNSDTGFRIILETR